MRKNTRILLKTILILSALLTLYSILQPTQWLGGISLYNRLFTGRDRLPFGESPQTSYNFSLNDLNAMFASHKLAASQKEDGVLRVLIIGDSSSWGILLRPEETLAGLLDQSKITVDGEKKSLQVFNLAYPTLSLSKDLLLLNRGLTYQPDLILWPLTMESFPIDKQVSTALVEENLPEFLAVAAKSGLSGSWIQDSAEQDFFSNTLIGQRRELADLIRLQLYGFMWAATGIDQDYPADFPRPKLDQDPDNTFHGVQGNYPDDKMAWEVLDAAYRLSDDIPILLINEPMFISYGENSEIRYNFYYSRQAYDSWRAALHKLCELNGWPLLDIWDVLPPSDFSNSAIHYNAQGAEKLKPAVFDAIEKIVNY